MAPLLQGRAVWLRVEDARLPRKTRKYKTLLVIAPLVSLGVDRQYLLVAMPPYGSEIVDPETDLKATVFARLGLSFSLARALVDAIKKLYGG